MLRALSEYMESHWPFLNERARRLALDLGCIVRACRPLEYKEDTCPNLNIQTTNICNANCVFCAYQYQDHFSPRRGVMSSDVFEKAVHGHKELGGRSIYIAPMVGDPLIDPSFVQRLSYVAREGFAVSFVTNGILLKRIDVEGLLRSGVRSFGLSTGPFEKEIYESIYRNSHYADLLEGVIAFLDTRNRLHANMTVKMGFRSSIPKREVLALPDFRDRIWPLLTEKERNSVDVMTRGFDSWGGKSNNVTCRAL